MKEFIFAVSFRRFTLLELLIVIAVIGILASMLLPALNRARRQGKAIACTGNVKSIGTAVQLYIGECDYFPAAYESGGGRRFYEEMNHLIPMTSRSYRCPEVADTLNVYPTTRHDATPIHYGVNSCNFHGSCGKHAPRRFWNNMKSAQVRHASGTLYLTDSGTTAASGAACYSYYFGSTTNVFSRLEFRHPDYRAAALFCDGHAEMRTRRAITEREADAWSIGLCE